MTLAGTSLVLGLSDGGLLFSQADDDFEAWQLVAAGRGMWVSLPGGDLAAFEFATPT